MKLRNIFLIGLLVSCLNAKTKEDDMLMRISMYKMEQGMNQIQVGFIQNSKDSIKSGIKLVAEGMNMFKDKKVIAKHLPKNKQHLANVAVNSARNVIASLNVIDANIDVLNIKKAARAYGDTMNACAKCHSIVRDW